MVFEHHQLLSVAPEGLAACVEAINATLVPAITGALVHPPQIVFRGCGRLCVLTRWHSEATAISVLGTAATKKIWAHLQHDHGAQLGGTQAREYAVRTGFSQTTLRSRSRRPWRQTHIAEQ
jgi:hypothetical protein